MLILSEIGNLNSPVSIKNEFLVGNLPPPPPKIPRLSGFIVEIYQTWKEEKIQFYTALPEN